MATLLHIDSSLFPEGSASREVTAKFVEAWKEQHPAGTVVYRDLAAQPLPHLDSAAAIAGPEHALRAELAAELDAADAILIGAPMYNFSIPSTLKAWFDHAIIAGHNATPDSATGKKPFTIVASRGGSYAPGTPREDFEFVQNYLRKLLEGMFGATDIQFIVPELTLAPVKEEMAALRPLAEESRTQAHEQAAAKGKELATRLAA
ncbi:NAD(P)H-dependent oxidoreductase [Streptomyces sp. DW26H14]|uniref:NAD(P)H-dependent oxidoreductase n=1 Tax=Streptomyces sp. DW26H14 TaxID=3435395 RepID=UPI00403E283D